MSFLEKLQRSMRTKQIGSGVKTNTIKEAPEEQTPQEENAASFAAFRSAAAPEDLPEDADPQIKKSKLRGRPRKIITSENVDEVTGLPPGYTFESEEPQIKETPKKTPSKTMANKKTTGAETKEEKGWLDNEGQLAVNVYQTETDLVLQAAIAGIKVEDLDVLIEDDVITIKGNRPNPLEETGDYFIEECYWGPFARKVILPVEVDSTRADAAMKDGVLMIRIPKIQREKKKKLTIKE